MEGYLSRRIRVAGPATVLKLVVRKITSGSTIVLGSHIVCQVCDLTVLLVCIYNLLWLDIKLVHLFDFSIQC